MTPLPFTRTLGCRVEWMKGLLDTWKEAVKQKFSTHLQGLADGAALSTNLYATVPLAAVANSLYAEGIPQISQAHGLPKDGHVLNMMLLGEVRYLLPTAAKFKPLRASQSKWDLGGHAAWPWGMIT